jgi:hypothetical protein
MLNGMLSLHKIEKLLNSSGFAIYNVYGIKKQIMYIEILCIKSVEIFLLYISSRFELKHNLEKIYQLKVVNTDEINNDENYSEINITATDIVDKLKNHYSSVKLNTKIENEILRNIYNQLHRIGSCVQNLKYKLAIQYKNYMSCMRKDNSVDTFTISGRDTNTKYKFLPIVNIEMITNIDCIETDINTIKSEMFNVFLKTQENQIDIAKKFVNILKNDNQNIITYANNLLIKKKNTYQNYIQRLLNQYLKLCENEKNIVHNLLEAEEKYKGTGIKGFYDDMESSTYIGRLQRESSEIDTRKQKLIADLLELKFEYEDLVLLGDRILFDTSAVISSFLKNIEKLQQYSK